MLREFIHSKCRRGKRKREAGKWARVRRGSRWSRRKEKSQATQEGPLWGKKNYPTRLCCLVAKSCLTLCNPLDCSLLGCFVHGISQARTLEWVAISSSRGSSPPRDRMHIFCIGRRILYHWATWEAHSTRVVANIYDHNPEKWKSNPTVFWVHWLREHACGWFRLTFDRNRHNTVKQLSFN